MIKLDGGTIVCATRGGEGSRAVQMAAIKQAKESGNKLIFLYITDPASLGEYDESLSSSISNELDWMGETLLRTAQRRADSEGLLSEVRIRQGKIQEEICRFLTESHAGLLLLGAPRGTTANVFGDDAVERFAQEIMNTTHVQVQIIRPENFEL